MARAEIEIRSAIADEIPQLAASLVAAFITDPLWLPPGVRSDGEALEKVFRETAEPRHLDDRDQVPAYLETSNPRNIPLYERCGFEVMGEIRVGAGPVVTPMLRAPR